MALRGTAPLPLPAAELERMRGYLSPHYGGEVWQEGGERVLVVRVPHAEPDLVNDLERAVEHIGPGDSHDLKAVLLVGDERSLAVPPAPLQDLMRERVAFDARQCQQLRRRLADGHLLYRAPEDARRLWRLAIRVPATKVAELDDATLEALTNELGPRLHEPAYQAVHCVYLIASQDHVRLDADLFLQDLRDRHGEVAKAVEAEEQKLLAEAAERRRAREEREKLVDEIDSRIKERHPGVSRFTPARLVGEHGMAPVARGTTMRPTKPEGALPRQAPEEPARGRPLPPPTARPASTGLRPPAASRRIEGHAPWRRVTDTTWESPESRRPVAKEAPEAETASVGQPHTSPGALEVEETIEAPTPAARPQPDVGSNREAPTAAKKAAETEPEEQPDTLPPAVAPAAPPGPVPRLAGRLEQAGYAVIVEPKTRFPLALAAERDEDPERIIAFVPATLDLAAADLALEAARTLEADIAFIVAEEATEEARKRLVATKAKWVAPSAIADLRL